MPELAINDQLMQRIKRESKDYILRPPGEDEFTYEDYMAANETTYDIARNALKRMEDDGIVECRDGISRNGKSGQINVFKFVEEQ